MSSEKGQAANRKAQKNYRSSHPEKVKAQQKARSAGADSGRRCKCGAPATHKHHTSYGSDGGSIEYLCHKHHVKRHHPTSNITKGEAVMPSLIVVQKSETDPGDMSGKTTKLAAEYHKLRHGDADETRPCRLCQYWLPHGDCTKVARDSDGPDAGMIDGDSSCKLYATRQMHVPARGEEVQKGPGVTFMASECAGGKYEELSKPGKVDEAKWERAKAAAKKQGGEKNYKLIMHIYQQMTKSVPAEDLSLRESVLVKSMDDDNWYFRFSGSPYEAKALKVEEDYLAATAALDAEHKKAQAMSDAAWAEYDKSVEAARKRRSTTTRGYERKYKKESAIRERYMGQRRQLALDYIKWQRQAAEARKSLNPDKSGMMGETLGKAQEATMDRESLFNEIRERDVDEILKAYDGDGNSMKKKPPVDEETDEATQKGETTPMVGAAGGMGSGVGPGMMKGDDVSKSMNSTQQGEPSGEGLPSASQNLGPYGAEGGPSERFDGDSKSGMPAASPGPTQVWSDDDEDVNSQMSGGPKPLEQSTSTQGSPDLDRSANQQMMEHYGMKKSEGAPLAESPRDVMRYDAVAERALRAAQHSPDSHIGFAPPPEPVQKAEPETVNVWHQGAVQYSDAADQAIAKAQNEDGYIIPEPTLGIPHSPLTERHQCVMCKSQYPSMYSKCPECGTQAHASSGGAHGQVVLEKAVADRLRPPAPVELNARFGIKAD
jgi:hypothetical protein